MKIKNTNSFIERERDLYNKRYFLILFYILYKSLN